MNLEDAIIKAIGKEGQEEEEHILELLEEQYDNREIQEFLWDSLFSKIKRDRVKGDLKKTLDDTSNLSGASLDRELPQKPETEVVVRRYINIPKFISLLETGLWFSRLTELEDNFEGFPPEEIIRDRFDTWHYLEGEDDPPPYNLLSLYAAEDKVIRNQSYVSCWRYGDDESAVFWDAYLGGEPGLAIETTVENLRDVIRNSERDVMIGEVEYEEYKGNRRKFAEDSVDRIYYKRKAFKAEKELRLLIRQELDGMDIELNGRYIHIDVQSEHGFNLSVTPDELIDRAILAPGTKKRTQKLVCQSLDYHGVDADVLKSSLDVSPRSTAPINSRTGEVTDEELERKRLIDCNELTE